MAERFGEEGMKLVIADLNQDALDTAGAELVGLGYEAIGVRTDVSKLESVEALRDATLAAFGAVHVLCNNAGVASGANGKIWLVRERLHNLALQLDPAESVALLRRWRNPADALLHPRSPLNGGQLQSWLALPPGPRLGRLIEHLSQERAFGRLPTPLPASPAQAEISLQAARLWWDSGETEPALEASRPPRSGPAP